MSDKTIVLDANILIRAILGTHVYKLINEYSSTTRFLTVEIGFLDAKKYIPRIIEKFGGNQQTIDASLNKLEIIRPFITIVPEENLRHFEHIARMRLKNRDEEDWPFLALSLLLDCPIWTEDKDFFGTGVSIWTSDRVEIFLSD